jgi:hypothetical protein
MSAKYVECTVNLGMRNKPQPCWMFQAGSKICFRCFQTHLRVDEEAWQGSGSGVLSVHRGRASVYLVFSSGTIWTVSRRRDWSDCLGLITFENLLKERGLEWKTGRSRPYEAILSSHRELYILIFCRAIPFPTSGTIQAAWELAEWRIPAVPLTTLNTVAWEVSERIQARGTFYILVHVTGQTLLLAEYRRRPILRPADDWIGMVVNCVTKLHIILNPLAVE